MKISQLYQDIIIDHSNNPRNNKKMDNATHQIKAFNPLCGDNIIIYLLINNNIIKNISYTGDGCAISIASVSIMTEIIENKNITEAMDIFNIFQDFLINKKNKNKINHTSYKLKALSNVKNFPSRIKCATLAWHSLKSIINNIIN